jgi:Flp pilus assembly protein TadD
MLPLLVVLLIFIVALPAIFPQLLLEGMRFVIGLRQTDPKAWFEFGTVLTKCGRRPEATIAFKKAIELNSDYSEAWEKLGDLYEEMGLPEAAERAYRYAREKV